MTQPTSTTAALAGAATAAGLIAHQVAGKAVRDALFLSVFPSSSLPYAMAGAAALSLIAVLWLSRSMARYAPATLMPILFAASAVGLVGEWGVGLVSPAASAVLLYLHTTAFGAVLISIFWSVVNERFDPSSAKRAVARIAAGGTIGGVLGAIAAWRGASLVELPVLVLFLAGLHAACAAGTILLRGPTAPGPSSIAPAELVEPLSAFKMLRSTPILRELGFLVGIGAAVSAVLDYGFSAAASAELGSGPRLLEFFGVFWLVVSVASFLLQITLGPVAIKRLGLAANIAVLPAITIVCAAAGIAAPGLPSTALLRGTESAHRNTLFRSAYETLYTPLTEGLKRSTKALIDVGCDRFGTVVGSGVAMAALALRPELAPPVLLVAVIVMSVATLPVAWQLHRSYVTALEQGLREAAVALAPPTTEAGPSQMVTELKESLSRDRLIEHVEALSPGGLAALTTSDIHQAGPASMALLDPKAIIDQARELLSPDVERARRALREWPASSRPVVGLAIVLMAHPQLHREAVLALRKVAHLVTGELVDALLDPDMDFLVRRRIPRVLVAAPSQRAADGLIIGIKDARFEVRYECARALADMTQRNPEILVSRDAIVTAIRFESEKGAVTGDLDIEPAEEGAADPIVQLLVRDRIDRSLEHVFTILSLHFEREPLRMAFHALHHEDLRYRGTALEYLHTVIPAEIRDALWPLLGAMETAPLPEGRPAREILLELVRATTAEGRTPIDLGATDPGTPAAGTTRAGPT